MEKTPNGSEDTFGHRYLTKYGWKTNAPLNTNTEAIIEPLFELKSFFDERKVTILRKVLTEKDRRKFTLWNEIYDLTFQDTDTSDTDTITETSPNQAKVQYFKLGSHDGPLLKQLGDRIQEIRL